MLFFDSGVSGESGAVGGDGKYSWLYRREAGFCGSVWLHLLGVVLKFLYLLVFLHVPGCVFAYAGEIFLGAGFVDVVYTTDMNEFMMLFTEKFYLLLCKMQKQGTLPLFCLDWLYMG